MTEIPVLLGCTASGKTDLSLRIASGRSVEIVSADSRQIYRMMDIGTAKPTPEELEEVPHHMIDLVDPSEHYSAGRFAREATEVISDIVARGAIPLVVGGSGLYILALAGHLDDLPERNEKLRSALDRIERETPGFLQRFLQAVDPESARSLSSPRDMVRVRRALEITLLTGRPASRQKRGDVTLPGAGMLSADRRGLSFRYVGMEMDDEELRPGIERRVDSMLARGLVGEVEHLYRECGYGRENSILGRSIGYTEVMDHIDGDCSLEDARERIVTNTWRLSRRQLRLLRRIHGVRWTPSRSPLDVGEMLGMREG